MRPPRKVKVLADTYAVETGRAVSAALDAEGSLGHCERGELRITLDVSVPHTVAARTMLHEVLHAAWDCTPLREMGAAKEETAITALAPVLITVLRENPALVAYLVAD
ncbi:hypothetical protein UFOVP1360_45 [uncultured Caudovirales phage]|uniref:Uncharacterized protein n=1 Tax=uncultured Caudovirales phage TaxID=2100421 RepID=A0A6J5S4Q8_9CAUD|nr:hypothetical protein UFOVP1360_45 [uncultured Caudovirales phage]